MEKEQKLIRRLKEEEEQKETNSFNQREKRGGGRGQELTFPRSFHHSFQASRKSEQIQARKLACAARRRRRLSSIPPQHPVQFPEVPRRVPAFAAKLSSQVKRN
jgi:hypothetical protein